MEIYMTKFVLNMKKNLLFKKEKGSIFKRILLLLNVFFIFINITIDNFFLRIYSVLPFLIIPSHR